MWKEINFPHVLINEDVSFVSYIENQINYCHNLFYFKVSNVIKELASLGNSSSRHK